MPIAVFFLWLSHKLDTSSFKLNHVILTLCFANGESTCSPAEKKKKKKERCKKHFAQFTSAYSKVCFNVCELNLFLSMQSCSDWAVQKEASELQKISNV